METDTEYKPNCTPENLLSPEEIAQIDSLELGSQSWGDLENYHPRDLKANINISIDSDIIQALRAEAKNKNTDYQTLLNQKLREYLFNEKLD